MKGEQSRFVPELKRTLGHTLFGSLQTPKLWEPLVEPAPLKEAALDCYQQADEALVWEQEVP